MRRSDGSSPPSPFHLKASLTDEGTGTGPIGQKTDAGLSASTTDGLRMEGSGTSAVSNAVRQNTARQSQRQHIGELHRELEEERGRRLVLNPQSRMILQRRDGTDSRRETTNRTIIEGCRDPSNTAETDRQIEELLQRDPSQGPILLQSLLEQNLELLSVLNRQQEQLERTIGGLETHRGGSSNEHPIILEEILRQGRAATANGLWSRNDPTVASLSDKPAARPATDPLARQGDTRMHRGLLEPNRATRISRRGVLPSTLDQDISKMMQVLRNSGRHGLGGLSDDLPGPGTARIDPERGLGRLNEGRIDQWMSGYREPSVLDRFKPGHRLGTSTGSPASPGDREAAHALELRQLGQFIDPQQQQTPLLPPPEHQGHAGAVSTTAEPPSTLDQDISIMMQVLRNSGRHGLGGLSDDLPGRGTARIDPESGLGGLNEGRIDQWMSGYREPSVLDRFKPGHRLGTSKGSPASPGDREAAHVLELRQLGRFIDPQQQQTPLLPPPEHQGHAGTVSTTAEPVEVSTGYAHESIDREASKGSTLFPLSAETDELYLAPFQIEVRKCIEFFAADANDVNTTVQGRKKKIRWGQVGIRCSYCRHLPIRVRKNGAVYYPNALRTVYQSASNITRTHLIDNCQMVPKEIVESIKGSRAKQEESLIGKKYWIQSCVQKGIVERDGALWMG